MRGLQAIQKPEAAEARTQRRSLQGRSAAEDGEHGFLASRGMAARFAPPGEESRAQPLRGSGASGPIATLKAGRGRRRGRTGRNTAGDASAGAVPGAEEAFNVLRRKLHTQSICEGVGAEG